MHHRLAILAVALTSAAVTAQGGAGGQGQPYSDPFLIERVVHNWPVGYPSGSFEHIAVGRFVPDHPGLSVVSVRGGSLAMSFQPGVVRHFEPSAFVGVYAIATIPEGDGPIDQLAVVDSTGLWVAQHSGIGFELVAMGRLAGWADVESVRVCRQRPNGRTYFAGRTSSGQLRLAIQFGSAPLQGLPDQPVTDLLDLAWIDWVPGGQPELAFLTESGLAVVDATFTSLLTVPFTPEAGFMLAPRSLGEPGLHGVFGLSATGPWFPFRATPSEGWVSNAEPLDLPGTTVVGIGAGDIDADGTIELVITDESANKSMVHGAAVGGPEAAEVHVFVDAPVYNPVLVNHCAAIVVDIDQDSQLDVVYLSDAADALAVVMEAPAVMDESGPPAIPQTETDQFVLWRGLGTDPDFELQLVPPPSQPLPTVTALRVVLPDVDISPETRIMVTTWQVEDVLAAAGQGVDPKAEGAFLYSIDPAADRVVDLRIPLEDHYSNSFWGGERYFIELRLVKLDDDRPVAYGPATWTGFMVKTKDSDPIMYLLSLLAEFVGIVHHVCSEGVDWGPTEPFVPYEPNYDPDTGCSRYISSHTAYPPQGFGEGLLDVPEVRDAGEATKPPEPPQPQ